MRQANQRSEIQYETRLFIRKENCGKGVIMAFPMKDGFYVIDHDELVAILRKLGKYVNSDSWRKDGNYSIRDPGTEVRRALDPYRIPRLK